MTDNMFDKAAHELKSTLALLMRQVVCREADVALACDLTYVDPQLRTQTIAASPDRITRPRTGSVETQWPAIEAKRAALAGDRPATIRGDGACEMEVAACAISLFDRFRPGSWAVDFEPMKRRRAIRIAIVAPRAQTARWQCSIVRTPATGLIRPIRFKTAHASRKIPPLKGKSRPFPATYLQLPIKKNPIPVFRFAPEQKERFRRALAEKAGTVPANILLNVVYYGLNRMAFASVNADNRGVLHCAPRPEAVGRRRSLSDMGETCYLAVGQRMDTKARVTALSPMENGPW
ncbi:MAG: hypothetical protein IPK79_03910 [Vampirovibrionales bacterium]|nr:hypothetical protein [Vampirovibrionales bacterium]